MKVVYVKDSTDKLFTLSDDETILHKIHVNHGRIDIPEGIKVIDSCVLYTNSKVNEVNFPSSLEIIREGAFNSANISSIHTKNEVILEKETFSFAKKLRFVDINCRIIPKACFLDCGWHSVSDVGTLYILKNTEKINDYAFAGAFIDDISIPKVIEIKDGAFKDVTFREECLTLPESLKSLGHNAFDGTNLKHIYLPNDIENIGNLLDTGIAIHLTQHTFDKLKIVLLSNVVIEENTLTKLLNEYTFKEANNILKSNEIKEIV